MAVENVNSSSSLAEVIDRILDKGVVVDAWIRLSLVGIELLTIEARIVVASVETYLKYAEAVGLTTLAAAPGEAAA
ncbi:MAG: gas vesicle structural protein GvpA [Trichodesmium sp. St11_bin5]|nr:gas vesicle structural protein GvpA [Trichodesmium sp. St11_bin5]